MRKCECHEHRPRNRDRGLSALSTTSCRLFFLLSSLRIVLKIKIIITGDGSIETRVSRTCTRATDHIHRASLVTANVEKRRTSSREENATKDRLTDSQERTALSLEVNASLGRGEEYDFPRNEIRYEPSGGCRVPHINATFSTLRSHTEFTAHAYSFVGCVAHESDVRTGD